MNNIPWSLIPHRSLISQFDGLDAQAEAGDGFLGFVELLMGPIGRHLVTPLGEFLASLGCSQIQPSIYVNEIMGHPFESCGVHHAKKQKALEFPDAFFRMRGYKFPATAEVSSRLEHPGYTKIQAMTDKASCFTMGLLFRVVPSLNQ